MFFCILKSVHAHYETSKESEYVALRTRLQKAAVEATCGSLNAHGQHRCSIGYCCIRPYITWVFACTCKTNLVLTSLNNLGSAEIKESDHEYD